MPDNQIRNINKQELEQLYIQINNAVIEYIIENETSISEEKSIIQMTFNDIATKTIKETLIQKNEEFENLSETEQQKHIAFNLKGVEKVMMEQIRKE